LLPPPVAPTRKETSIVVEDYGDIDAILAQTNRLVGAWRLRSGELSELGKCVKQTLNPDALFSFPAADGVGADVGTDNPPSSRVFECDSMSVEEAARSFKRDYWMRQKPVVIRNYQRKPVDSASLGKALLEAIDNEVGVKLSDSHEFEGVEPLSHWLPESGGSGSHYPPNGGIGGYSDPPGGSDGTNGVPDVVLKQLASVDHVVVRAAHAQMTLREVLTYLQRQQRERGRRSHDASNASDATVYVEYQRIKSQKQLLLSLLQGRDGNGNGDGDSGGDDHDDDDDHDRDDEDVLPTWIRELLPASVVGEPHLWLGDGTTLGKLHFDPFDNLLVQIRGTKIFSMAPASSLPEGHLREGMLEARGGEYGRHKRYNVTRGHLTESTSMVHTVTELADYPRGQGKRGGGSSGGPDDSKRSPHYGTVACTVREGEALFVPSYWWHEVQSQPAQEEVKIDLNTDTDEDTDMDSGERGGEKDGATGNTVATGAAASGLSLNVAVNFWFPPLFSKEFPCTECAKTFNYNVYAEALPTLCA
jgi:hypothetical protein